MRPGRRARTRTDVWKIDASSAPKRTHDHVVTEEPLEVRLAATQGEQSLLLTMRTPGHDYELAAGLLYSEGVIESRDDIHEMTYCVDAADTQEYNVLTVRLRREALPDLAALQRHFFATSSCGVCGKAGLEALARRSLPALPEGPRVGVDILAGLPDRMREAQSVFAATGGLHAAALFDPQGDLLELREDVGRHNALDKLFGARLLAGKLPVAESVVVVSGRASYEVLQKCLAAGVPFVASVSAPSSLAVALAEEFGLTLVGFLREQRFNVYAAADRLSPTPG